MRSSSSHSTGLSLLNRLAGDEEVPVLVSRVTVEENFDFEFHLKHVDAIFARVFG